MIYHYTSIDTLRLILEAGKIQFNNLNAIKVRLKVRHLMLQLSDDPSFNSNKVRLKGIGLIVLDPLG